MKKILTLILAVMLTVIAVPNSISFASANTVANEEIRFTTPQVMQSRSSEVVYYTSKVVLEENSTVNNCPCYYTSYPNACGAVAGANIVGFYDKYYEDLIPDYKTYLSNGNYKPTGSTAIPALIGELYTLMRTNVDDVGCTQSEFLNGLSQYVSSKGRSVNYTSAFSNGNINYNTVKSAINNNKLLAIFCLPTELTSIVNGSNSDTLNSTSISTAHIMIVYGYVKIQYTLTNGSVRTDTYLKVTSGISAPSTAYYRINSCEDVVNLTQVTIS